MKIAGKGILKKFRRKKPRKGVAISLSPPFNVTV